MFWYNVGANFSIDDATTIATLHSEAATKYYVKWLNSILITCNNIIDNSITKMIISRGNTAIYNLSRETSTEERSLFIIPHSGFGLKSINYSDKETFRLKKHIIETLIATSNEDISYSYIDNSNIEITVHNIPNVQPVHMVQLPVAQQVQLPVIQPRELRTFPIEIVVDNTPNCGSSYYCVICLDTKTDKDMQIVLSCNHEFCGSCTNEYLNDYRSKTSHPPCLLCRGAIHRIVIKHPVIGSGEEDQQEQEDQQQKIKKDNEIIKNLQNICVV
jgi:hypothetical protein